MTHILVVSNGFGEDGIACQLIQALSTHTNITITPFPLVGEGLAFSQKGLSPAFKNPTMPSGGFIRNIKDLFIDLKAGLIKNHINQYKALAPLKQKADITIAVGDIFCCLMATIKNPSPCYFLPTAKSDAFMKHSWFEKKLMKSLCAAIYPRDKQTTETLAQAGVPAQFLGSPMFDNLSPTEKLPLDHRRKTITLLPGSRSEAFENMTFLLQVCDAFLTAHPNNQIVLSKAPSILVNDLQNCHPDWLILTENNAIYLTNKKGHKLLITEAFTSAINAANVVIGLAGTANEQAIHLGKPVLSFPGFGPQSTLKRFKEQQKLMGPLSTVLNHRSIRDIIQKTNELIDTYPKKPYAEPEVNASKAITDHLLAQPLS